MQTAVENGKWSRFGGELRNIIIENNEKPKSERKTLNKIFEEFSSKHDTTFFSAQQYYYTDIKPKLKKESDKVTMSLDESIEEFSKKGYVSKSARGEYKVGETIEIQVISISDFGVFGKTKEGFEGLIHISQIAREFVDAPEDYFYVGEKVDVKIIRFEGDKLSFSTRAIGGKNKINPAFKDLVKNKVKKIEPKNEEVASAIEPTIAKNVSSISNDDIENISNFIKKYSDGRISDKAYSDIESIVSNFGVFKTTMLLMDIVKELDISSMITEMVKNRLEGGHLRQTH
ncbi:MAG: S1 RNA-binding domain-containing protein [Psychrobacillus sp.]